MNKIILITFIISILTLVSVAAQIPGGGGIQPGVGTNPQIHYQWILPDDSLSQGTQLNIVPGGERTDIYSCILVGDEESRDTIADVFLDVFHPDDSFKYQMHAYLVNISTDSGMVEAMTCLNDALNNGLITSENKTDIEYNMISQPNWYMYKVYLPMYYHQPSGFYDVKGYAVDSTSRLSDEFLTEFEWVAGTYLELDFDSVSFGNIQPGAWKILNGDTDMDTPGMPTLKNQGNTEVRVGVKFSEFVGQDNNPNKVINRFDAQLRNMGNNNYKDVPGEHLEFFADDLTWFAYPISLCRQEKIDFSIHADIGIVPDNYKGDVMIYVEPKIVNSPPEEFVAPEPINSQYCTTTDCCQIDEDCSEGFICELAINSTYGDCVAQEVEELIECVLDEDCSQGLVCNEGVCEVSVEIPADGNETNSTPV